MPMRKLFPFFVTALILVGCNSAPSRSSENADTTKVSSSDTLAITKAPTLAEPVTATYKTKTGKVFTVIESHAKGASLSDITVYFNGDADSSKMVYTDVEPINKVITGDLDADGFDEIYIVTVSAGSGSAGNVYGLASNKDKSMSSVYVPPVEEKDLKKGAAFEGYEGHDEFEIVENSLARRFPVKTGKATMRSINYQMKKGETGYILFIKNSTAY
jgi:hypothetical protein